MHDLNGSKIFFIPAYGTDSTLYDNLELSDAIIKRSHFVNWLPLKGEEDLKQYATSIANENNIQEGDIIIGTSMGGIIGIEISKQIKLHQLIIISSIKSSDEKPFLFKLLKIAKIYKLIKGKLLKRFLFLISPLYGRNLKHFGWFKKVFSETPNEFLEWALEAILFWENLEIPKNLIHIHGSMDPLFHIRNIKKIHYVIHKGTHGMVRFRSPEISEIINTELDKIM